jgi:hypothetical protein
MDENLIRRSSIVYVYSFNQCAFLFFSKINWNCSIIWVFLAFLSLSVKYIGWTAYEHCPGYCKIVISCAMYYLALWQMGQNQSASHPWVPKIHSHSPSALALLVDPADYHQTNPKFIPEGFTHISHLFLPNSTPPYDHGGRYVAYPTSIVFQISG